ncbi:hypothetical protein K469DRAFT_708755 [Zopfia rhizophila CBS 207.26]|uniref:25S rRNA adenine-N(1) methyltransferase n=1 Tax=Zopfia rhizophila CBS 207.26 TaxID=1314779 RepID=A0A6A6E000_9PEZI|nr:hypothetical protein K469DRAFT_708755 [Zopfia rhizophila CBS 207.26]
MGANKKQKKALSHGRPPVASTSEGGKSLSFKKSRDIIHNHHRLQKEHARAIKAGDKSKANEVMEKIQENGGLKKYQAASKRGQSKQRGGDSSRVLVDWLQRARIIKPATQFMKAKPSFRLLEIGALSTENEISQFPHCIEVTRIDLNSQGHGIEQQDFMQRPLPRNLEEAFDIISLSLVLNYVAEPVERGEMLKRITKFLRSQVGSFNGRKAAFPALFMVLPLPCVANSRYLNETALCNIMVGLGFVLSHRKTTPKLGHYLFRYDGKANGQKFPKKLIRDGPNMNNFCIVVE